MAPEGLPLGEQDSEEMGPGGKNLRKEVHIQPNDDQPAREYIYMYTHTHTHTHTYTHTPIYIYTGIHTHVYKHEDIQPIDSLRNLSLIFAKPDVLTASQCLPSTDG